MLSVKAPLALSAAFGTLELLVVAVLPLLVEVRNVVKGETGEVLGGSELVGKTREEAVAVSVVSLRMTGCGSSIVITPEPGATVVVDSTGGGNDGTNIALDVVAVVVSILVSGGSSEDVAAEVGVTDVVTGAAVEVSIELVVEVSLGLVVEVSMGLVVDVSVRLVVSGGDDRTGWEVAMVVGTSELVGA